MSKPISSIQLSPRTMERLKKAGKMGESYEDVIIRLLNTVMGESK